MYAEAPRFRTRLSTNPTIALIARKRRQEITALLRDRFGNGPCFADDATVWLDEILPLIRLTTSTKSFTFVAADWVRLNTPGLTEDDIEDACARILPAPPRYDSASIGARLNVTEGERDRLGLTHITPVGCNKRKRAAKARKRKALALKAKRHAAGTSLMPCELSIERLAPWIGLGISRSTFKRMPKEKRATHIAHARNLALHGTPPDREPGMSPVLFLSLTDISGSAEKPSREDGVGCPPEDGQPPRSKKADRSQSLEHGLDLDDCAAPT
ncbi:hypothetical protein [Methylobacterium sp. CM6247]